MLVWMVTVFRIEADYEVYILMHLPLISQCLVSRWLVHQRVNSGWCTERVNSGWCTERVNKRLVHRTRKYAFIHQVLYSDTSGT